MNPNKAALNQLRIERTADRGGVSWGPFIAVAIVATLAAGGAYVWFNRPQVAVVKTAIVRTAQSSRGGGALLNASGYVTARRAATVSSKVTGKVLEVLVEEGAYVEEQQVLARLDASNVQRSLELAEAQLGAARAALGETEAQLAFAMREVERYTRLTRNRSASALELDRAETEADALQARLERQTAEVAVAERQVALWRQQIEDAIIRAPFAGVVTAKNAQPGEMISPMSVGGFTRTGICTIVDMDSLEIEVDVNESYINRVHPDQPVEATLDAYPDWRIPARVIAIIPTADRQKATVQVRIGFERSDARILPEMSVKVAFQDAAVEAEPTAQSNPTIPQGAVRERDGRTIVWLARDGVVERRAVQVGEARGDEVEIVAGLSSGERVVIDGVEDLSDGARVREVRQ